VTLHDVPSLQNALLEQVDCSISGGAVNQLPAPSGRRRVISRGRGSRIWDVDGREYVDYVLGSGPLILGHAHPAVVKAVQDQAARGSTFYALTQPTIRLAERIIERVPCAELVQFCNSGAEATLYAMRLARAYTGRPKILKFEGGFHGASDYALMSLFPVGAPRYPRPEASSGGIPPSVQEEVLVAPFNDVATTLKIAEEHADKIAAIIVEPVQRVIEPSPGFLPALRQAADRHGIILIFDEIVTGFRLAPGGAQEYYDVTPDIAALGKILGGGYPLAAVAGREEIMRLADHRRRGCDDYAYVSGTLNGNPVAAAAGLATLDVLDGPGAYDHLHRMGDRLRSGLRDVFRLAGVPAQVLGIGPLFQVFITDSPIVDHRGMRRADVATIDSISTFVFDRGHFLSREKGYLSLAHTEKDVDELVASFSAALTSIGVRLTHGG